MFPNFNELFAGGADCLSPCRANTLLRLDTACFPRENFSQIPLPGFDAGADTLIIFQGNSADAAYDATVIQHETSATGRSTPRRTSPWSDTGIDTALANKAARCTKASPTSHRGAFQQHEVGPSSAPAPPPGGAPGVPVDSYLRTMDNTMNCPEVLWGRAGRRPCRAPCGRRRTTSSRAPTAATQRTLRDAGVRPRQRRLRRWCNGAVGTAFPALPTASDADDAIFQSRGAIGCSKVLTASPARSTRLLRHRHPRPGAGQLGDAGPHSVQGGAAHGALRVRVTAAGGGGPGGGQPPQVRVLTRPPPAHHLRAAGRRAERRRAHGEHGGQQFEPHRHGGAQRALRPDLYVTLAAPGGGATLQNVNIAVDPLGELHNPRRRGHRRRRHHRRRHRRRRWHDRHLHPAVRGADEHHRAAQRQGGLRLQLAAELAAPLLALALLLGTHRRRA